MQVYGDGDIDFTALSKRRVAILGYGNQGHAHALNLRDCGLEVVVGARENSPSGKAAEEAGFAVVSYAEAAAAGDVVMMSLPDEQIPDLYTAHVEGAIGEGAALGFAHGLAVHFGHLRPRGDLDVFLVAPKGAGRWLRQEFTAGRGLASFFAVHQDRSGNAREIALAYASGLGCGRAGVIATSFAEECETDLFGEQAVLCGGIPALIRAGYDTLVAAGYAPEVAYFECLHEAKLIVDLLFEGGPDYMNRAISNTAEYGGYLAGERLVTEATRREMRAILKEVRSGAFAEQLIEDTRAGGQELKRLRQAQDRSIEPVGERVRALMPWLGN